MSIQYSNDKKELAEIYQVAHMYYDLNMLQADIAAKLYLSRPKVSRMLTQARELGIVEIKVKPVLDRLKPLEEKLCSAFGLKDAVVVTDFDNLELMDDALAEYAAHYVSKLIRNGATLGITNGHTVNGILNKISFPEKADTEIVQLMGATAASYSMQDTNLILSRLVDTHANVKAYTLSVPLYINDLYLKEVLMQDSNVHVVLQKMQQCSMVLTGISKLERGADYHISWHGQMGPHHIEELTDRGAVGSICAQYFNINGIKVSSEWNAKIISMNLNDLVKVETRIGVGQGLDKLEAITGALHGKLINVLVTDANTASDLIRLQENRNLKRRNP